MEENDEKKSEISEIPDSYTASELMSIWRMGSTQLYRALEKLTEQDLRRYRVTSRTYKYDKADADRLTPEMLSRSVRRGRPSLDRQYREIASLEQPIAEGPVVKTLIDVVKNDDLPALYFMESVQLGFERAIFPTSIMSWLSKNDHAYWILTSLSDRKDIKAVFGILSIKEELVSRLATGEILAKDISPVDTFDFTPERRHVCFITSATALPDWYGSMTSLFQQVFSYWAERSIQVEKIYLLVPSPDEESPELYLARDYFFSPLDKYGDNPVFCRLSPLRSTLSPLVQEYRTSIQNLLLSKKEEISMVTSAMVSVPKAKEELSAQIREKTRDFTRVSRGLYDVDEEGHLVRNGDVAAGVIFREIRSDADILEALRINASLFGASKKYTEDELVAHRRKWLEKNIDTYRVLEVNGRIVSFINAFPFPDNIIKRIIRGEMRVGDVPLEELRRFVPGEKTDVYLQTVGIHKDFQGQIKRRYGIYMISGFCSLINDLGRRGISIGSLYTRSDEIDGINLSYALGLKEYSVPGVDKIVFRLDFDDESNVFLHDYQMGLTAYQASQFLKDSK